MGIRPRKRLRRLKADRCVDLPYRRGGERQRHGSDLGGRHVDMAEEQAARAVVGARDRRGATREADRHLPAARSSHDRRAGL